MRHFVRNESWLLASVTAQIKLENFLNDTQQYLDKLAKINKKQYNLSTDKRNIFMSLGSRIQQHENSCITIKYK